MTEAVVPAVSDQRADGASPADADGPVAGSSPLPAPTGTDPAAGPAGSASLDQLGERVGQVVDRAGEVMDRAAAASGRAAAQLADRLRNTAELLADRGNTTIADEVVEKIAGIAAREVPGVYDLGGDVSRFFAAVGERVGLGEGDRDRGVSVRLDGATAVVEVTLVIEFGFVVHSVTEAVRAKVIGSVENLLGLAVTEVNIRVDDVHVPDTGPVHDDEARAVDYQV